RPLDRRRGRAACQICACEGPREPNRRRGNTLASEATAATSGIMPALALLSLPARRACYDRRATCLSRLFWRGAFPMRPYVRTLWAALMVVLALASCSSPGSDLPPLPPKADISSYHLGAGDRLEIKVLGADELAGQYSIQDDGTLRMLMIGEVQ